MRRPNLFIVGAMKSGTRSLHAYLAEHPEIFMARPGEPTHFAKGDELRAMWPRMYREGYWASESKYLELFLHAGDARVIGESSTNYAKLPWITGVPQRIHAFEPSAKIIYIMREPVARTISHYWHAVEVEGETRPLERAVRENSVYTDVSYYALQIRPYLEVFGRDAVRILTIEEIDKDPSAEYSALLEWLNVNSAFVPNNLDRRYHMSAATVWQSRNSRITRYLSRIEIPDAVRCLMPPTLQYYTKRIVKRLVDRSGTDIRVASEYLRAHFEPQVQELEVLLGRSFPEWRQQ